MSTKLHVYSTFIWRYLLQAYLLRKEVFPSYTRSTLLIGGETFYTIERPWLNNQRNISCIPSGNYIAYPLKRSASGKYKDVFHLVPVEGRSGILIHQGNLVSHSKGCLIIGSRKGTLGGKPAVLGSKTALRRLNQITQGKPFNLQIIGAQHRDGPPSFGESNNDS